MIIEWFGDKTTSLFDVWSMVHFAAGIAISSFLFDLVRRKLPEGLENPQSIIFFGHSFDLWIDTCFVVLFAYSWEFTEFFLENGALGQNIAYWFHGIEFWANKFLTDPLLVYLGYKFGKSFYFKIERTNEVEKKDIPIKLIFFSKNNLLTLVPSYQQSKSSILTIKGGTCFFLIVWLLINISLPHSMYLQHILLK